MSTSTIEMSKLTISISPNHFKMKYLVMIPSPSISPHNSLRSGGFTLVELLVVISIIGLLAGLAIPAISSGMNKAKESTKISNLRGIYQACMLWSSENDGRVVPPIAPPTTSGGTGVGWSSFLTNYLSQARPTAQGSKDIFVDPFFKGYNSKTSWLPGYAMNTRPALPAANTSISYSGGSGTIIEMRMLALTDGPKRAFIIDCDGSYTLDPLKMKSGITAFATNRHGGGLGMVMMYDGHVEKLNMDQAFLSANDPSKQ
jgi:prepilin-type N-terminal cleavage/methylation domain-containing protein/prepilin-type processing-associated H-X9-DG protein